MVYDVFNPLQPKVFRAKFSFREIERTFFLLNTQFQALENA